MAKTVGILALQGDFAEHAAAVERCGAAVRLVKTPGDLEAIDSLIIPGGESTAIGIVAQSTGLIKPLRAFIAAKMPVWGTCAGLIMLADRVEGQKHDGQVLLGGLNITATRNYYGRQIQSFSARLSIPKVTPDRVNVVFIRSPGITAVGPQVEILSSYQEAPIAVRQGNILATSFHTELDENSKFHNYFLGF